MGQGFIDSLSPCFLIGKTEESLEKVLNREKTEPRGLSRGGSFWSFFVGNGFGDFAGLKAASANKHAADASIRETGLDALKVRVEAAAGDTGDLFTDTA
jgi:hypothetical protein